MIFHNSCSFNFKISMKGKILRVSFSSEANFTILFIFEKILISFSKRFEINYLTNIISRRNRLQFSRWFNRFPSRKEFLACQKVASLRRRRCVDLSFSRTRVPQSGSYIFPYLSGLQVIQPPPFSLMIYVLRESYRYAN